MTTRTAPARNVRLAVTQALACLAIAIAALLITAMAHRTMHVTVLHGRHPAVCGVTVSTGGG